MSQRRYTSIGGQAVIEGVMMRSPRFLAIAVRRPDGCIVVRERRWKGIAERVSLLKKPFLRGMVTLVESMVNGVEALSYSANVAAAEAAAPSGEGNNGRGAGGGGGGELSSLAIAGSIFFAFVMGIALFVVIPHYLTVLIGKAGLFARDVDNPLFHLVDGAIKVAFLVAYIRAISLMKDIHRVFQYHGAEHKSIHAFEAGDELTVANARRYPTLHPRCGTSFLLFLLVISILVFSAVFPLVNLVRFSGNAVINHAVLVLVKIALMFPVAGISYEFIRASAARMGSPFFRALIWPGLALQRLTTRGPDDAQLEVALVSLKRVLLLEKSPEAISAADVELRGASEVAQVAATAAEFPEA